MARCGEPLSCDERLRFLRTRRSRTRCPTTKGVKAKEKVALSEWKFEAKNTAEKKEVSDEKAVVQSEEVALKINEMEKSSDKVQEMVWKRKVGRSECGVTRERFQMC